MKKILILLIALNLFACNDCSNVECAEINIFYPAFTIRNNVENLFVSKEIDIKSIEAYNLDGTKPEKLIVDVFHPDQDTLFRVNFISDHKKIRIKWPIDSVDINIQYDFFDSECCSDFKIIKNMTSNGKPLSNLYGVIIIKK